MAADGAADVNVEIPMEDNLSVSHRDDDLMSNMSKTTMGSMGGRRKKLRHFNLQSINRYGTIESTYLMEKIRSDRINDTEINIQRNKDTHFITPSEVHSMKKAMRIQINEDYEGVPEAISKIKMKVCYTYIPVDDSEDAKCKCGRAKKDARHKVYHEFGTKKWKSSKYTNEVSTKAWGKVALSGGQANFVRMSNMTPVSEVKRLMMDVYKMKKPGVIVSLLGSVNDAQMSEKLETVIERNLAKAAAACEAWVTTSGVNGGCVQLIGNGIRTYGLHLYTIGICGWGSLAYKARRRLQDQTNEMGNVVAYPTNIDEGTHVEQNHSTFLLIDNGQVANTPDDDDRDCILAAMDYRIQFENYLRDSSAVPVISVICKGGFRTAEIVKERVESGDTMIVLAKSGGLASLLFRAINHMKVIEKLSSGAFKAGMKMFKKGRSQRTDLGNAIDGTVDVDETGKCACVANKAFSVSCKYLRRKIIKHMGITESSDEEVEKLIEKMFECVRVCMSRKELIGVYHTKNNKELDKLLLDAMVEYGSSTANVGKKLTYAFELSNIDVVENMLNDYAKDKLRSQTITVLIIKAIIMNRPHMVKLFLNTCNKQQLFQLKVNMPILYDSALYAHGGSHLIRLITYYVDQRIVPGKQSIGIFPPKAGEAEGAAFDVDFSDDEPDAEDASRDTFERRWNPRAIKLINDTINKLTGESYASAVGNEEDPYMELTLWSVIMLRKEMALLFCKRTEDPIRCALLCMKVMTILENRKNVLVNSEEDEKLAEMKEAFESLAICTLEACYQENPEMTFAAARATWNRVKKYDYLQLAYEAECKRFIAHPACQDISEKRWRIGFVRDEGFWKVLLICLFPPIILIPGLVEFDVFANKHQDTTERVWWDKIFVRFKIIGKSPMIKFWMSAVFSLVFIVLHLRVLYMDTKPVLDPDTDGGCWARMILLTIWFGLLVIDEIIQVYKEKLFYWWKSVWNRFDLLMFICFAVGMGLCMGYICTDTRCKLASNMTGIMECSAGATCQSSDAHKVHAGRMILSIVTIFQFLRFSIFITSDLTLGPIVLMMLEMAGTFMNFFVIFCLIMIGFGAAYIGLLVEVGTFSMRRNIVGMVYFTYFQSLGELFLDVLEGPDAAYYLNNRESGSDTPWYLLSDVNTAYYYVCWACLIMFMILSNLMLLNILIAMFTESYERISQNQKIIWKFQRYTLMKDYEEKFLPTPLNLVHYPLWAARKSWKVWHPKKEYVNPLKKSIDKHLRSFVKEGLSSYIQAVGETTENTANRFEKYSEGLN